MERPCIRGWVSDRQCGDNGLGRCEVNNILSYHNDAPYYNIGWENWCYIHDLLLKHA